MKKVSLLSPARDLACGIEAVRHGADAVYIGAPRFGARAAVGCSVDDIAALTRFAHLYGARVYVALNTLLRDDELDEAERIIWQVYRAGADALIIQDLGITQLRLPPIALHASTQMDNRTPQRVRFLRDAGFRQVVLARELTIDEIRSIHQAVPDVALEVFIHGALCVSLSGQCYASQACLGRSANRGECAQMCRLPFTMTDAEGKVIVRNKHLLSLRDLCRLDDLEELIDAGVTSLKIEGRLKDMAYVKNVTAAYSQRLNRIIDRRSDLARASQGHCAYTFTPQVERTFNRGFTTYALHGRQPDISNPHTPKAMGEEVGRLKEQRPGRLTVAGLRPLHNGDGLCYLDSAGRLQGFRVNRVDPSGHVVPAGPVPTIGRGTVLYRNFDQELDRLLSHPSAQRRIALTWKLAETPFGFALTARDEEGLHVTMAFTYPHQLAQRPPFEAIGTQLSRLGNTPFVVKHIPDERAGGDEKSRKEFPSDGIDICFSHHWFIPASTLAEWRRAVIDRLISVRRIHHRPPYCVWRPTTHPLPSQDGWRLPASSRSGPVRSLDYTGNVTNRLAAQFYRQHAVEDIAPGFDQQMAQGAVLMTCHHCLRYAMGWCPIHQKGRSPYREPYFLTLADGRRFLLEFDCRRCLMRVTMDNEQWTMDNFGARRTQKPSPGLDYAELQPKITAKP